ncbi:MAG: T9SS type A sorting domain-containing protein, partial [Calditrichia bacterium]
MPTTLLPYPTVFSVDGNPNPAEGILCSVPDDVFSLSSAGGWGGAVPLSTTEGELFQSSGAVIGGAGAGTNLLRISGALGTGTTPPGPPPYTGPIAPPPGVAPIVLRGPAPFGNPWMVGTMGLQEGDNVVSLSFGNDGGDVLLFSVDPTAAGGVGSAVAFQATMSPVRVGAPPPAPSNWGGDPGSEAAGDVFIGPTLFGLFGVPPGIIVPVAAPPGSNLLGSDELFLGLQAPAIAGSALPAIPEDDLDALEIQDGNSVDADTNGVIDTLKFVFFSLDATSPTIGIPDPFTDAPPWGGVAYRPGAPDPDGVTPDDILISTGPGGFVFGIFASGVVDMGLISGDVIDALVLADIDTTGFLNPLVDEALFSLAAGSPTLTVLGGSPGDVYYTNFDTTYLIMSAATLGLLAADELNALDIGQELPDYDDDGWGDNILPDFPGLPIDNCPGKSNPDQSDYDWDGLGDVCDDSTGSWYLKKIIPSWNLVGLPLDVLDKYYLSVFPTAITGTLFGFNGGYVSRDSLELGEGYWLRFPPYKHYLFIEGFAIDSITIDLMMNWNIISGVSDTTLLIDVIDPGGIILPGMLFGFNGAYFVSDTIIPGNGYWLRTSAPGQITLTGSARAPFKLAKKFYNFINLDKFPALKIGDASSRAQQTLYFNVELPEEANRLSYSLPPLPPAGAFDARFRGDYRISDTNDAVIQIQSSHYPLTIRCWNIPAEKEYQYVMTEIVGNVEVATHILREGSRVEIVNPQVKSLKVSKVGRIVPIEFAVSQNYPNPFNPTTVIKYAIPNSEKIEIVIYNTLGQKVKTLVNGNKE